jgi:hypothetical protein
MLSPAASRRPPAGVVAQWAACALAEHDAPPRPPPRPRRCAGGSGIRRFVLRNASTGRALVVRGDGGKTGRICACARDDRGETGHEWAFAPFADCGIPDVWRRATPLAFAPHDADFDFDLDFWRHSQNKAEVVAVASATLPVLLCTTTVGQRGGARWDMRRRACGRDSGSDADFDDDDDASSSSSAGSDRDISDEACVMWPSQGALAAHVEARDPARERQLRRSVGWRVEYCGLAEGSGVGDRRPEMAGTASAAAPRRPIVRLRGAGVEEDDCVLAVVSRSGRVAMIPADSAAANGSARAVWIIE